MRCLVAVIFILVSLNILAVPARRVWREVALADGRRIEVTLVGDEFFHYFVDRKGSSLIQNDDGTFSYAVVTESEKGAVRRERINAVRREYAAHVRREIGSPYGTTGFKKGLVILVDFQDRKFVHTHTEFNDQFNQTDYSVNGHIGSVSDYFHDQSYGQLKIDFDVVGPYTVSRNMEFYGNNDAMGEDKYPATMVSEAVLLADADGIDFSQYDWNRDGYVNQVFLIYAGYAESAGASKKTIWPHAWQLSEASTFGDGDGEISLDGVIIDTYACTSELDGTSGARMDGIGTACHEFSHCLGLPDFYDTTANGSGYGMDVWSLLDYGCYNANACIPCSFTAYERWFCGWMEPTELTKETQVVDMMPISEVPEAYVIYNEGNRNEFYILENHQKSHSATSPFRAWDKASPTHGILVLHVDYDKDAWFDNRVNADANHQRMTFLAANNMMSKSRSSGQLWPGTTGATAFSSSSAPAATFFNADSNGSFRFNHRIYNITEREGLVSFNMDGADVNGDGDVNTADIVAVSEQIGLSSVAADVNDDGSVTTRDILEIVKNITK